MTTFLVFSCLFIWIFFSIYFYHFCLNPEKPYVETDQDIVIRVYLEFDERYSKIIQDLKDENSLLKDQIRYYNKDWVKNE
jgi:hypothetical protein